MEKQKKNDSGITLVALVVSIIVMLVLAGVSLNATVGENGIVTRAQEAALKQRVAEELENLNLELTKLNVDTISNDESFRIDQAAQYLVNKGVIDSYVTTSAGQIAAGIDTATGNKYFFGVKGDNTYKITRETDGLLSAELTAYTSGGDITGGYALVTADSFNNDATLPEEEKGKFTITSDAEVVFMDTISGALSIYVKSGVHATVGIYADMSLTNRGINRSAIDIEPGGRLDLFVAEGVNLAVNSGLGSAADQNNAPGKGGYAGIHCWNNGTSSSTLVLNGSGKITVSGGDAGNSALFGNGASGSGGGGAGAGIGGNGGKGGQGSSGRSYPGENGEDCGNVYILGDLTLEAYGGNAGAGCNSDYEWASSGSGYPAAGIGGGGAGGGGGSCCSGGGGFNGGSQQGGREWGKSEALNEGIPANQNGITAYIPKVNNNGFWPLPGGSYFCTGYFTGYEGNDTYCLKSPQTNHMFLGGMSGCGDSLAHCAGSGGTSGKGGNIKVSNDVFVYSYNGCRITDGSAGLNGGLNQTPIYAQNGYIVPKYEFLATANTVYLSLVSDEVEIDMSGYENSKLSTDIITISNDSKYLKNIELKYQGVGSGAGFYESSNGKYEKSPNSDLQALVNSL